MIDSPSTVLSLAYEARTRRERTDDSRRCEQSLSYFIKQAWPALKPDDVYVHNWHIDAVAEKLEAVSSGDITRLSVWLPPGAMKPVDVDALVLMGDGSRKRLGDVEVGESVITHRARARRVSEVHEQGSLEVLEVITDSGRVVRAAPDHPFLTPSGWVEAGDLEVGDALGTVTHPEISSGKKRPFEELRLIGYFVGDGNVTTSQANIACVDLKQGEDIVHCAKAMGFRATYAKGKARRYNLSDGVRPWLRETGLAGGTSWTKRVPEFIFSSSEEEIAHFIGAYFSCDGTIGHWRPGGKRSSASVIFNSVNRPLLEDVQHLLLRLGVKSRIREHISRQNNYVGRDHWSWRLVITSLDDTSKFIETIPVLGVKAERLASIAIKRTRFDEMLQPDLVRWVEPVGKRECRCLTVEEDGSFTANDLVVKNSLSVSVFWPAWEWTTKPNMRYWGASYETRFAARLSAMSRDLMLSDWYKERWGDVFKFTRDAENYYANDHGGTRLATSPESVGTGEHGHRIIIDDPIKAKEADSVSGTILKDVNEWYDGTVATRGLEIGFTPARIIVMQRLSEFDLAAHALELEEWEVLCLPERYEPDHPFVWPDDPRSMPGDLLWPAQRDDAASDALARTLTPHRAAGQLQQRPAAREGDLLQTAWWRFYDPRIRSTEEWSQLPAFSMVVMSLDCPQKDKETNDNVAIQAWGVHGMHRYLLDLRLGKMSYPIAKRATVEMAQWARRTWPRARHNILIENTGYGSDMILDLKSEFTGVTKINPQQEGDKVVRADAASDSLSSGHCFLPGTGPPWRPPVYEAGSTPADIAAFIHSCSSFPNAAHEDDVDSWSQMVNWLRGKQTRPLRTSSATSRRAVSTR